MCSGKRRLKSPFPRNVPFNKLTIRICEIRIVKLQFAEVEIGCIAVELTVSVP